MMTRTHFGASSVASLEEPDLPGDTQADSRTLVVAARFKEVMEALGLDDPNLADTPLRVARAYGELFAGLRPGAEPELRTFPNTEGLIWKRAADSLIWASTISWLAQN